MAENKIDLRGYRFEHRLEDIQTLNERATRGELHISAISIHAYAYVSDRYALLPCSASMGDGYGPILISADMPGSIQVHRMMKFAPGCVGGQCRVGTAIAAQTTTPSILRSAEAAE